jgi:O-antigen ligase
VTESRRDLPWVALLLAPLALLPFGAAAELPLLLAALLGVVGVLRGRIDPGQPCLRLASLLFAAYWLPEFISAFDSVAMRKSWTEVAADLRFLPFLWLAVQELGTARRIGLAMRAVALLLAIWCLDALLQAATGWSLGGASRADRLSGIFGDDNLKLGGVIATVAPFGMLAAWQRWRARGALLAFVPILAVVLLAGARAAWIVLLVATALLLWRQLGARRGALAMGACVLLGLGAGIVADALSPRFAERVERTVTAFAGQPDALDHALAGRVPIFRTALVMSAAHPFNGVGVRAFRHAYPDFAAPGDPWVDPASRQGAAHAHHWLLEVLSETGAVGLSCWLAGIALAWRALRSATPAQREPAAPAGLALVATLFPLNTHYAVYSSFWAVLLFVLLALWLAALRSASR